MVKAHPDKYIEQPEKIGFQKAEISPQQPEPLNFSGYRECAHVETVVTLSRKKPDDVIEIDLELDELDITAAEAKATYPEIKEYVLNHHGLKVSSLYIAQVKRKCGLEVGENYNLPSPNGRPQPQVPPEKEAAIRDALKSFSMI